MNRSRRPWQSLPVLLFGTVAVCTASGTVQGAGPGHGGGGGHVGGFGGGAGWHGGYGPGFRSFGYPYGYGAFGFGLGLGYGYYGYPGYAYGYPGYAYGYPGYGYGYPGYAYPYPVDGGPPPSGDPLPVPQATPGVAPAPAGNGASTPVLRLPDTDVTLIVRVPAEATIWVNGVKTTQTGVRREFVSRGLIPGRSYTFDVRAQWMGSDGKPVTLARQVPMQAGERRALNFPGSSAPATGNVTPAALPMSPGP